jgi:hypothetical protein
MSGTVNHGAFGASPWGSQTGSERDFRWARLPPWLYWLDSKPGWIALTILGFILWWPVGLALLVFLIGSGRMGCGFGRRYGGPQGHRWGGGWARGCGGGAETQTQPSSGNRAFDEYRAETLRRLEQEQSDFAAFLDRLRFAKDKAEFDEFMAERRRNSAPPEQPEQPAP